MMKKIIITAESGSDIPKDLADEYGIFLVPMHVTFNDITKDDGTFSPKDVYSYYDKDRKLPKTSGCNPSDFIKIFDEIFERYSDCHIIHMAYSSVTTCSYQSALIAKEDNNNITLVDTKQVAVGQCAAVIKFAKELKEHPEWTVEEAVKVAVKISQSVKMCFVPSNLDYLRAGGRVSNATALCGNILSIHPQIELLDGYLKATKKYRGKMNKVVLSLIANYSKENMFDKKEVWFENTIGFSDDLKEEATKIAYELGYEKVNWITAGGVITTHGGPNTFCMAGFLKK